MEQNFQNTSWFVTGASGLVGSTILTKLFESDVKIIALVREKTDKQKIKWLLDNNVQLVYGDLTDKESYKYHLGTCDIVVHTAAAVQNSNADMNWKINLDGTKNIVEAMLEFSVRRIIHISTVGIYGISSDTPITEEKEANPIGDYSRSKYAAEEYLFEQSDKLDITIFRPPYIIGDIEHDRHVLPTIYNGMNRRILPKWWRKNPTFGFVHARDIASAVLLAGSLSSTPNMVYNIQSFSISYDEIIKFAEEIFNSKIYKVPISYGFVAFITIIMDIFRTVIGKRRFLRKRIRTFEKNWIFNTDRIERDLQWTSQYVDKNTLYLLLSKYKNNQISKNDINIIADDKESL